jgi:transcription initiation factor IIF auxiliary subunit
MTSESNIVSIKNWIIGSTHHFPVNLPHHKKVILNPTQNDDEHRWFLKVCFKTGNPQIHWLIIFFAWWPQIP